VHTFAIYLLFITLIRIHCRTSIYSCDSDFIVLCTLFFSRNKGVIVVIEGVNRVIENFSLKMASYKLK